MNLKASVAPPPNLVTLNRLRVLVWIGAASTSILLNSVAQAEPISDRASPSAPPITALDPADSNPEPLAAAALPEAQPPLLSDAAASESDNLPLPPETSSTRIVEPAEVPGAIDRVTPPTHSAAVEVSAIDSATPQSIASDSNPSQTHPADLEEASAPIAPDQTEPILRRNPGGIVSNPTVPDAAPQPAQDSATEFAPAESSKPSADAPDLPTSQRASDLIGRPLIHVQGAYLLQGNESSARGRVTGLYIVNPNVLFGATVDLTGGNAFSDSRQEGLNLNELYVAVSPAGVPGLRFVAGLMDLTSYFDRNSFAKDALTHFFNPVFQTNPALAAAGISSRLGVLANWSVNDNIELKAATFSSSRNLDEFALDAFAGEIGVRFGNAIVRGTYVSDRNAGQDDGLGEYQLPHSGDRGLSGDDRESAYGINAEYFIPQLRLGLFGRYGWYNNSTIDRSASTYSVGFNFLDLFWRDDRLGLGYGRQLSNDSLRRAENSRIPDVLEFFYDVRLTPNLRAGVTLQERNEFSETIAGFRIRADFDVTGRGRRI